MNRINVLFQKRHPFALQSNLATATVTSTFVVNLFKNTNNADLREEQRIIKEVFALLIHPQKNLATIRATKVRPLSSVRVLKSGW